MTERQLLQKEDCWSSEGWTGAHAKEETERSITEQGWKTPEEFVDAEKPFGDEPESQVWHWSRLKAGTSLTGQGGVGSENVVKPDASRGQREWKEDAGLSSESLGPAWDGDWMQESEVSPDLFVRGGFKTKDCCLEEDDYDGDVLEELWCARPRVPAFVCEIRK